MFAGSGYFGTPGVNDPRTIEAIRTTLYQSGKSQQWDMGAGVHGKLTDLPGGDLSFAAGADAGQESLAIDFDGLTKMGKVPGLNANNPTSGRRDNWAVFFEARVPLTGPDMNIPALHRLDVTAAVRHESFDPGGDATVPKIGVRWQPLNDEFTLRASYAQSFIAPTTYQLFGGKAVNVPVLALPDGVRQEYTANLSNPNLQAVHAENWGAGIVISPKAIQGLTVSIDYYHVKTKEDIFRVSSQLMVDDINTYGSASQWAPYFSQANGNHLTTTAPDQATDANWGGLDVPLVNGAAQETDGLDITANYRIPTEKAGTFTFFSGANVLFNYKYSDPIAGGPYQYKGMYTDAVNGIPGAQGTLPDFILNLGVTWEIPVQKDAFAFTINSRYIPSLDDPGTLHPSIGSTSNDFTVDGASFKVDSYYQIDVQLTYEFGKHSEEKRWFDGTRLTVGCNNVTGNDPPLIASSFEDNTDKSTYDILGRFVYFEVAKKF
jgi:iron complex outermembrane receptor protein